MQKQFKGFVMRFWPTILIVACAFCIPSVHASKKDTKVPGVFRQAVVGSVTTLDPKFAQNPIEQNILFNTQDTLLSIDPETGQVTPDAAEFYVVSEDGLTLTFTLKKHLFYSNGDRIDAGDYAYALKRHLDAKNISVWAKKLSFIQGAPELIEGLFYHPEKVGIATKTEKGKSQLVISLTRPDPQILYFFASTAAIPLPEEQIKKHGNAYFTSEHMLASGPFVAKEVSPSKYEMTKNRHHRDFRLIQIDKVELYVLASTQKAQDLFLKGKVDQWGVRYSPVTTNVIKRLQGSDVLLFQPDLRSFFIRFHTRRLPVSQFKIRQALSMAIDRDEFKTMVVQRNEQALFSFTPLGQKLYDPPNTYYFDLQGAQNILEQLGYCIQSGAKSCLDLPRLTIVYPQSLLAQKLAIVIKQQWEKVGFKNVDLRSLQGAKFVEAINQGNFTIAIDELAVDTLGFFDFLSAFESTQLTSIGVQSNIFDEMVNKANREAHFNDMVLRYRQAESYLLREVMVAPLLQGSTPYLKALHVQGYKPNLWDIHPWKHIQIR